MKRSRAAAADRIVRLWQGKTPDITRVLASVTSHLTVPPSPKRKVSDVFAEMVTLIEVRS